MHISIYKTSYKHCFLAVITVMALWQLMLLDHSSRVCMSHHNTILLITGSAYYPQDFLYYNDLASAVFCARFMP